MVHYILCMTKLYIICCICIFVLLQPEQLVLADRTLKTALHYCAGGGVQAAGAHAQCADLLVMQAPELVESRDEDGFTPLHLAVIAGNVQLVQFLIASGADVNALDSERHSVVHWATGELQLTYVRILVEHFQQQIH